ncbi:MAG TPA: hypothetical protein VHQ47_12910 [Phycisphaerae bacterium]|nr:hypothetical protein [Phycisphaerae bacterium]
MVLRWEMYLYCNTMENRSAELAPIDHRGVTSSRMIAARSVGGSDILLLIVKIPPDSATGGKKKYGDDAVDRQTDEPIQGAGVVIPAKLVDGPEKIERDEEEAGTCSQSREAKGEGECAGIAFPEGNGRSSSAASPDDQREADQTERDGVEKVESLHFVNSYYERNHGSHQKQ